MKKIATLTMLSLGMVFGAAGCSVTTANIDSITMASEIDETTQEAVTPATTFSSSTGVIYAATTVRNAPSDTNVLGEWFYNGEFLAQTEVTVDGTRTIGFSLSDAFFQPGDYTFRASIVDTDKLLEVDFMVVADQVPVDDTLGDPSGTSEEAPDTMDVPEEQIEEIN
jgi:hypothetical protein